jgi:hypothetical protein
VSHTEARTWLVGLLGLCSVLACAAGSATMPDAAAGGAAGSPPGSAAGSTAGTGAGAVGGTGEPADPAGGGHRAEAAQDASERADGAVSDDARAFSDAARD